MIYHVSRSQMQDKCAETSRWLTLNERQCIKLHRQANCSLVTRSIISCFHRLGTVALLEAYKEGLKSHKDFHPNHYQPVQCRPRPMPASPPLLPHPVPHATGSTVPYSVTLPPSSVPNAPTPSAPSALITGAASCQPQTIADYVTMSVSLLWLCRIEVTSRRHGDEGLELLSLRSAAKTGIQLRPACSHSRLLRHYWFL
jgi:hypothetical protein